MIETNHYIESEASLQKVTSKIGYGELASEDIIPIMLCDDNFDECRLKPYIWSKLFKKEYLQKVQMPVDERIGCGEDGAVVYPYVLNCKKIYISEYAGYHYVQRTGSMTNADCIGELQKDKALLHYLKTVFENSDYAGIMMEQLNQYAKSLLLLRQISVFDDENTFLTPFGGVLSKEKIIIYGAGKLGQSIYRYIKKTGKSQIFGWFDKNSIMYQNMGFPVNVRKEFAEMQRNCDKIIIAVSSKSVFDSIRDDLLQMGINEQKIIWLTKSFIDKKECILNRMLDAHL